MSTARQESVVKDLTLTQSLINRLKSINKRLVEYNLTTNETLNRLAPVGHPAPERPCDNDVNDFVAAFSEINTLLNNIEIECSRYEDNIIHLQKIV